MDYSNGIRQYYSYDNADNVTGMMVMQGSLTEMNLTYGYDKAGRLKNVNDYGKNYSYTYDSLGRLTEQTNGVTGVKAKYQYYSSGNVKSLIYHNSGSVMESYEYTYDQRGNRTEETVNGETTTYYYDALSRLTMDITPEGNIQSYEYDEQGNISLMAEVKMSPSGSSLIAESKYTYDPNNRLLLEETTQGGTQQQITLLYDNEGNQVEKTESYQQDNSTISATMKFSYNGFNQLSGVEDSAGNSTYYTYNGSGLRSVKTTNETTIKYYYDGNSNIILETDADNVVTATNVRGLQLISRENEGEDPFYYLQDVHGDVTKLLDQFANVIKDYSYDPFGNGETEQLNPVSGSISTTLWQKEVEEIDNPFRYCGEYYDLETNTYYLRARNYDPTTGRFLSEDTNTGEATDPLSLNLYTYCKNNPIRYFDPSGHIPTPIEAAEMAAHIYNPSDTSKQLSGGWVYVESKTGGDNMVMGVYYRIKDDGTTEYALVNKGTTPTSASDWKNNGQQLFGSSDDMKASIDKSKQFVQDHFDNEITMVGHSKGGAEAAANAVASNKNSIIFNPATVNLGAYGLDSSNYSASMTAFIVKGDALNTAEGWFSKSIDKAVYLPQQYGGNWYQLWQTSLIDRINNHSMGAVKKALKEAGYN